MMSQARRFPQIPGQLVLNNLSVISKPLPYLL